MKFTIRQIEVMQLGLLYIIKETVSDELKREADELMRCLEQALKDIK